MNQTPAPFRALPPLVVPRTKAAPVARNLNEETEQVDRFLDLPAEGPRQIRVSVIGGALRLRPTDRPAALDFYAAQSALGINYDHKRHTFLLAFDEMLRHGVIEWQSIQLLAALNGLELVLEPQAEVAMERYLRHIDRQLRPIPRMVWHDDRTPSEGRERLAATFTARSVKVIDGG